MAPVPPLANAAWKAYVAEMKRSPRYQEHTAPESTTTINGTPIKYRTITLDQNSATYNFIKGWPNLQDLLTLKYTVETKGSAPTDGSGYPLFLAMHGGGETSAGDNDGEWLNMTRLYKGGISQGIYIALRGVGNTWDLHFRPSSYVMIERLIENFILFGNVNPDQVYLLGFSAGGDGTYRIACQLAQRFSAVNAGGGHPGGVRWENMANLPICLQVGEYDSAWGRCQAVAGGAVAIDDLNARYPKQDAVYQKDVYLHADKLDPNFKVDDPNDRYIERHWGWESTYARLSDAEYPNRKPIEVVKDYKIWFKGYIGTVGKSTTELKDTHAINWMLTHKGNRTRPRRVVWDLRDADSYGPAVISNISGRGSDSKGRGQNYWLDINRYTRDTVGEIIEAYIDSATNIIYVVSAQNYLRIHLTPDMVAQPSKPVSVKIGSQILLAQVKWDNGIVVAETLFRNDPTLMFTGALILTQQQGKWVLSQPTAAGQ